MSLFDIGVATIFAREFLEGGIILGNYRTIINKSDEIPEDDKKRKLNAVNVAAGAATVVAILMILAVGIPLGIASKNFDNRVAEIIEGVSKLVAAIAILGLSLKIPVWLGVYEKVPLIPKPWKKAKADVETKEELLSVQEIRFNVAWNIWREVAECGVFLLPYFLQREGIKSIPLSALAGIAIALVVTLGFFYANSKLQNKVWIAVIMATLTALLAIGLFAGGCHECEEVLCLPDGETSAEGGAGEGGVVAEGDAIEAEGRRLFAEAEGGAPGEENYCTSIIYRIKGKFWDQSRFPMALFKPFGYSSKPTVLQTVAWWCWFWVTVLLHMYKWFMTRKIRAARALHGNVPV